jgi:hypothetical protein
MWPLAWKSHRPTVIGDGHRVANRLAGMDCFLASHRRWT